MRFLLCAVAALLALWPAPAPAQGQAQSKRPSVVFHAPPQLAPNVRAALEDALATQLSLIQTTLRFELAAPGKANPGERLTAAKQIAAMSGAIGVFWLDASGDAPWLLYAVDARA